MNTLTTISPLLDRLHEEADAVEPATDAAVAALSGEALTRLMRSKTEYPALYSRLRDFPLAVSRETGVLLYTLARGCGARAIVEFGTSFGFSTLYLTAALRDNGGGRLITSEFEPPKAARARQNLTEGGLIGLGRSVKATRCTRCAPIFQKPSTFSCSTAPRHCTPKSWACRL